VNRVSGALALLAVIGLLAACSPQNATPTPTSNGPTPRLASPTVNPVPPVEEGDEIHDPGLQSGVSNPTQAALPAEGQPNQDLPTITPFPTAAWLPMPVSAPDGLILQATFYAAPVQPAPGILLLPMEDSDRSAWEPLAQRLQAQGYAVLAVDLRGYGETGGKVDWTLAPGDVRETLSLLTQLPGVNPFQIVLAGAGIGANLALNACADYPGCAGAVLLSPGLDLQGITTPGAIPRLGVRPLLIAASENDGSNPADSVTLDSLAAGDHQLVIYPAAGHGTEMLTAEPGMSDLIAGWLGARVIPPTPRPADGS
jgi:pimeloyl-ACP methyl ester carboxylesterase